MKILVVDDSQYARKRIMAILREGGYETIEAESGDRALEVYLEEKPAIVTTDLLMPGMDGIELVRRLKEMDPRSRIIVVSSDVQALTREEAMAAGASAFLAKMESPWVFLNTIKAILEADRPSKLSTAQRDAVAELTNMAMARAARALESLLNRRVDLTVPDVRIILLKDLNAFFEKEVFHESTVVQQVFTGEAHGYAYLIFGRDQSEIFVSALLGIEKQIERLSSAEQTALIEVGNVVLNAAVSIIGDQLETRLSLSLPTLFVTLTNEQVADLVSTNFNSIDRVILLVSQLRIGDISMTCYLVLAVPEKTASHLIDSIEV